MDISEKIRFHEKLSSNKPYFGTYKAAFQGVYERHVWMQATIKMLAQQLNQKELHVLEIGSWAGGSAITWAKAIKKFVGAGSVTCIDTWQPYFDLSKNTNSVYLKMQSAASDNSILDLFLHNIRSCNLQDMIIPMMGQSKNVFPCLARDRFHVIFIDGSHIYTDVKNDIIEAKKLICENGIICGDDLELQANASNIEIVRQNVNANIEYTQYNNSDTHYHPGVTLAVQEEFGEVAAWDGYWTTQKQNGTWKKISLETLQSFDLDHFSERPKNLQFIESIDTYNILLINGKYVAVAQALGEINFHEERIGEREFDPFLLISDSLQIMRQKIQAKIHAKQNMAARNAFGMNSF